MNVLSLSDQSLTLYELLSLIISVVGFVAVIISLVLLGAQTRHIGKQTKILSDTIQASYYDGMANRMLAMDQIFISYPEMHPYFYEAESISEDHPDYNRAWAIAAAMLDYFDAIHSTHGSYLKTTWWQTFLGDIFASSPILCEYLHRARSWYDPELVKIMSQAERRPLWTPPLKKASKPDSPNPPATPVAPTANQAAPPDSSSR